MNKDLFLFFHFFLSIAVSLIYLIFLILLIHSKIQISNFNFILLKRIFADMQSFYTSFKLEESHDNIHLSVCILFVFSIFKVEMKIPKFTNTKLIEFKN